MSLLISKMLSTRTETFSDFIPRLKQMLKKSLKETIAVSKKCSNRRSEILTPVTNMFGDRFSTQLVRGTVPLVAAFCQVI